MSDQSFGQSTAPHEPPPPTESVFDIRTMPEAFFPKAPIAAPLPWGIIALVGVLVFAVVGAGVYVLFFWETQPTTPGVTQNTGVSSGDTTSTPPEQPGGGTETPPSSDADVVVPPSDQKPSEPPPSTTTPLPGALFPQFGIRTEDSDFDNLTNEEEKALNTDPTVSDTDKDGYSDGQEIENLYDPLAPSPASLEQSRSVMLSKNEKFGYRFLYPGVWNPPRPTDAEAKETMITTPIAGEFMEVIVQENPKRQSAFDWYASQLPPGSDPKRLSIISIENLEGVWSLDGKTAYFTVAPAFGGLREWIYGITYNTGEAKEVNYPMMYRMIIESFRVDVRPPA